MAPNIRSSKVTVDCPLFAADFDPQNNDFLLVGGGGGEGRSGVGNKIYLLDTSRRDRLSEVACLDLSSKEDSVSTLAVADPGDHSVVAFVGINSSQADQQKDRNEHLRSFRVSYPPRKRLTTGSEEGEDQNEDGENGEKCQKDVNEATSTALSRVSLFKPEKSPAGQERETYQRILRLSPWLGKDAPRIGAVATGFASQGQIVLFRANTQIPQRSDVLGRISLGTREEAEDLDIIPTDEDGRFKLLYTDGASLFSSKISKSSKPTTQIKSQSIYTAPSSSKKKYKIRAIRFLTMDYIVLLQNTSNRTGCELVLLSKHSNSSHAVVVRRRQLPSSAKVGLGLDVCPLPSSPTGERQYVLAASSGDHSIHLFTLDYTASRGFSKFQPYATQKDVHPFSMTRISFSTFISPPEPITPDVLPQYLKLVSVSVGNTAVVHTMPLSPYPAKSRHPRYVLVNPGLSDFWQTTFSGFMALLMVAFGAFILQAFTEIRGGVPPTLGAKDWLSPRLHDMFARPYMYENNLPVETLSSTNTVTVTSTVQRAEETPDTPEEEEPATLRELVYLNILREEDGMPPEALLTISVQDHGAGDISVESTGAGGAGDMNDIPGSARRWEELSDEQRGRWKWKLVSAGHLAEADDENALYGVYFSESGR